MRWSILACPRRSISRSAATICRTPIATAQELAAQIRELNGVSDVLIPQDLDYPALELNVNREMASRLGLISREVVDNVITALNSNHMIAPSYWVDPKTRQRLHADRAVSRCADSSR